MLPLFLFDIGFPNIANGVMFGFTVAWAQNSPSIFGSPLIKTEHRKYENDTETGKLVEAVTS